MADDAVAAKCKARGVRHRFPRVARTHPKYDSLAILRQAHRRICDAMRKSSGARVDLEDQDAEVIRQARQVVAADVLAK